MNVDGCIHQEGRKLKFLSGFHDLLKVIDRIKRGSLPNNRHSQVKESKHLEVVFSLFHFTYRVQYFLTLLLLVKGAGAGQIQSGDRGQVKLNFLELLAKRKSAGPLLEITGNGAIHSRYWIEDTGKVIVNVFRCYWMEGFLQLLPGLEDNPLISRRNKTRILGSP